ncbi:hypothetical protein BC827DRAFT_185601 [Russula dissimulans]|nr:hypothetical protein BC827DRAFT_185601 [Russula dissimulans]
MDCTGRGERHTGLSRVEMAMGRRAGIFIRLWNGRAGKTPEGVRGPGDERLGSAAVAQA